jgi:hypothetical protein
MSFFLRGRTVAAGNDIEDQQAYPTIDAALAQARARINLGDQIIWIVERSGRIVLSAREVTQALAAQDALVAL